MMYYENKHGKVYYEVHGPEHAPAVIFSHGVAMDHATFYPQMEALQDKYQVVIWDMPFHGLSSSLDDGLSFSATAADFVIGMMDHLQLDTAIHVGQSLGSFVVQQTAAKYPERVSASVHLGGGPLYPPFSPLLKAIIPLIPLSLIFYPGKTLYRSFAKHKALTPDTRAYMAKTAEKTGKKVITHLTQEMVRDAVNGITRPLEGPMLLCYGDHELGFVKKMSQQWHEQTPLSQLAVVKNAHHIANQDHPEEFNRILLSFLEECC